MIQTQEQTYQQRFDMYMGIEKEKLVEMLIECNRHLGTKMKLVYTTPIPEIFSFLRKNFTYDNENEVFQSKKRRLCAGTGDDSSLFIASNSSGTTIWWKENRGFETTIFDGKELKTEEEFNQIFELLGIKTLLKWT